VIDHFDFALVDDQQDAQLIHTAANVVLTMSSTVTPATDILIIKIVPIN